MLILFIEYLINLKMIFGETVDSRLTGAGDPDSCSSSCTVVHRCAPQCSLAAAACDCLPVLCFRNQSTVRLADCQQTDDWLCRYCSARQPEHCDTVVAKADNTQRVQCSAIKCSEVR